jgi:cystathionine beta-lyase/cystathionine gamma-synthase
VQRFDDDSDASFDTLAVHAGAEPDELTGAVSPPIYQTSTYAQDGVGRPRRGFEYARSQNPTRERFERAVAALEGGGFGIAFASGSATTAALAELAGPDDEIVVGDDVYGGTYRYLERVRRPTGVQARYVDLAAGPDALWEALNARTRLVWLETPTNPLLKLIDIAATAATVRERFEGRTSRALVVVDNTFASPALQRPLDLGADVVFQSATKYLAGQSDWVLGVAATRDAAFAERLRFLQNAAGAVPGPMDCWLALRGIKTLPLRMRQHDANGRRVAEWLGRRSDVTKLYYPGLPSHPQHELACRQMTGFGGMISLDLGDAARARKFVEATRIFALAESLGGVESLIGHPASMTHASVPPAMRQAMGLTDSLVRLSCGIEDAEDLLEDLDQAFSASA